jgi:hypothetical protein
MTARGLSRIAGAVAIVAVLVVTAMVTWSVLRPSDHESTTQVAGGPALGDLTGYVGRVDRESRTIDVSTSLLGVRPVILNVTNDTSIMVRGKQGGLGDLSKDMPVRVFYEVRDDVKYVTSIQVVTEEAPVEAKPPAEAKAPVEATPAPPVTVATPKPTPPALEPVKPRAPEAPPASIQAAAPPAAKPPRVPAATTEAAPVPPPRVSASRPADTDADDGSAAIDWLLKESRKR